MAASSAAPTMPMVAGVSGAAATTASHAASISWSWSGEKKRSTGGSGSVGRCRVATMVMPKAAARTATAWLMAP